MTGMSLGPNATATTPRVTTTSPMLKPSGIASAGVSARPSSRDRRTEAPGETLPGATNAPEALLARETFSTTSGSCRLPDCVARDFSARR